MAQRRGNQHPRKARKKNAPVLATNENKGSPQAFEQFLRFQLSSELLNRANLASRVYRSSFGGDRDFSAQFGYKTQKTFEDYLAWYEGNGLAARIIDLPVSRTWDRALEVTGPDNEDPPFTIKETSRELSKSGIPLLRTFRRLDTLAQLGKFAGLLIGVDGSDNLEEPIEPGSLNGKDLSAITFLTPICEPFMEIKEAAMFGKPTVYKVTVSKDLATGKTDDKIVHHSRLIHVADGGVVNDIVGIPQLQRVLDRLVDVEKLAGAGPEMFWKDATQLMVGKVNPDADINAEDLQDIKDSFQEFLHSLARGYISEDVDVTKLEASNPDPRGVFEISEKLVSAAAGIPRTILFGNESGTLAGSLTDRVTFADMVEDRRTEFAGPIIARPTFERLQSWGVLAEGEFELQWPAALRLTDVELAEMRERNAKAWNSLSDFPGELDGDGVNDRRKVLDLPEIEGPRAPARSQLDEDDPVVSKAFADSRRTRRIAAA